MAINADISKLDDVLNSNTGFIKPGTEHDASEFAATSIAAWWDAW